MNITIHLLLLFILLNCTCKLSLWPRWPRLLYGVLLGAFTFAIMGPASRQSKTTLTLLLQNSATLQNIAILVAIESILCIAFCFCHFARKEPHPHPRRQRLLYRILRAYPCLLMLPATYYTLAQLYFVAIGTPFPLTTTALAIALALLLPLAAEGLRRLLPTPHERVELHLILSLFVCLLGLMATQTGHLIYAGPAAHPQWTTLAVTLIAAALLIAAGALLRNLQLKHTKKL